MAETVTAWRCMKCGNIWIGPEPQEVRPPHHCYGDCGHMEFERTFLDEGGKEIDVDRR